MIDTHHRTYEPMAQQRRHEALMLAIVEGRPTDIDGRCADCRCVLCGPQEHERGTCNPCRWGDEP
jgi:hypothetical protein